MMKSGFLIAAAVTAFGVGVVTAADTRTNEENGGSDATHDVIASNSFDSGGVATTAAASSQWDQMVWDEDNWAEATAGTNASTLVPIFMLLLEE